MMDIATEFGANNLYGGHDVMPDGSEFIWFLARDGHAKKYFAYANSLKTCIAKYAEAERYYQSFLAGRDGR